MDADVIALAASEARILLTEDKDFGWYAFVAGAGGVGVVLVRFPGSARRALGAAVLELVTLPREPAVGARPDGHGDHAAGRRKRTTCVPVNKAGLLGLR
jgi:hypothetical protein